MELKLDVNETQPLLTSRSSQRCEKARYVMDIVGGILLVTGIAAAAFSKAQYVVPVIAAAAAGTCIFLPMVVVGMPDADAPGAVLTGIGLGIFGGGIAGGATAFYTWKPLIQFVSTSQTAKLAGPLGLGMIACGASLWIASSCLNPEDDD